MYLFTYGTLQPAANLSFFEDNDLAKFLDPVSRGVIKGDLVYLSNTQQEIQYPGAVNVGVSNNHVLGTLFKVVNMDAFVAMDRHEGFTGGLSCADSVHKNFYQRIEVEVRPESGDVVEAQVYVLNRESDYYHEDFIVENGRVSGGDWLMFIKKQRSLHSGE